MVLDEVDKAIGRAAFKLLAEVKRNTPVRTGALRNSIILQKTQNGFEIGSSLSYAEAVEMGVEPHVIVPKEKKALFWPGAPHPVKKVNHPGFSGRFMFLKASKKFEPLLKQELEKLK